MLIILCFNHFFEIFCWNEISVFKILEKILWMFVMSSSSGAADEALTTGKQNKQTFCQFFKNFKIE